MEHPGSGACDARQLELAVEAAELDFWEYDLVSGAMMRPASRIYAELGY